jgi:hypothetical protein
VRHARGLMLLAFTTASLAVAASAAAGRAPAEDGTLSVRDGRAAIVVRMKGSVIGKLKKGRLVLTEPVVADMTVVVRGAEDERDLPNRTTVYSGTNIWFRIADDRRFTVRLEGKGLNFSAVGRGRGWMDGWGDPAGGVFFDGSYSLNGTDYPTLPNERTAFELSAPRSD